MTRLEPLSLKIGEYEAQVTTGLLQGSPVAKVVLVDSQESFLIPITRLDLDDAWLFTRKLTHCFTAIERTLLRRQSTSPENRAQIVKNLSWRQGYIPSFGRDNEHN